MDGLTVVARYLCDFPTKFGLPRQSGLNGDLEGEIVFERAFRSPDASHKARLYPNHVDVTLWVPVRDYDSITADMLQAVVDYDPAITQTELPVLISTFPTATRVKQVTPSALQYVILVNSEIVK